MKKAKVSELKNRLSYYLRFVRRGQSVLIYDRDRPIARIDPVRQATAGEDAEWIAELERSGALRPPVSALPRDWLTRRREAPCDVVGTLLEDRASGR